MMDLMTLDRVNEEPDVIVLNVLMKEYPNSMILDS
jgi:hypothetical protein